MQGRPGVRVGLGSLWFGFRFLLTSPRSLPYAVVPALVLGVSVTICVAVSVLLIRPWAASWIGSDAGSALSQWVGAAVGWLVAILAGLFGLLVSLALASPLSGPALEKLVLHAEERLQAPPRAESGFFKEMWFGLKAQAFALVFAVPLLLLLWLVDLLFPPAIVVTLPLKLLVAAFSLSWNLLDYPLTLRGVRMRDRLRLFRAYKLSTLSFGVGFAVLFWLPCFQVVMLPIGVVAATRLVWQMLAHNPELALAMGCAPLGSGPPPAPPLASEINHVPQANS